MITHRFAFIIAALLSTHATASLAQSARLSPNDSALVGRILLAEDRRDSTDASLVEGSRHTDSRIRTLAARAKGRIRDPQFASRDSLPALPPPTTWPEPAWRVRLRGLTVQRNDCGALRIALADSAWPVRFRAMDLVTPGCSSDSNLVAMLRGFADASPGDGDHRSRGGVSWHAAAHAIVALAKAQPSSARSRIEAMTKRRQWQARMYAARAAAVLADTTRLRVLARDSNDNVKEAAIDALAKLAGHADDDLYLIALRAEGAQAVRAAANALKGSPRAEARAAASKTFDRWVAKDNASARDTRRALLQAAGRPESDDKPPTQRYELPPDAIALALGAERKLRVTLSPETGGGSFVVRLRGDVAPMMAARVLALARRGYYNELTWHRVEHDFVIQGGSPGANEYVGYPQFLRDELGTVQHLRGTVGMSTRGHDTGDAQWFVNLRDNQRLTRDYTVFGEVVEGIDVVDGILEGDVIASITEVR
jgi:cyclophilin family peptidyl-prolyl cis-trans isomerase